MKYPYVKCLAFNTYNKFSLYNISSFPFYCWIIFLKYCFLHVTSLSKSHHNFLTSWESIFTTLLQLSSVIIFCENPPHHYPTGYELGVIWDGLLFPKEEAFLGRWKEESSWCLSKISSLPGIKDNLLRVPKWIYTMMNCNILQRNAALMTFSIQTVMWN